MYASKVTQVVQLSSNIYKPCLHCKEMAYELDLGEQISHYLKHGYTLLHVGQETSTDSNGKPWQSTVAVVGK
jgi:hypothetical protein